MIEPGWPALEGLGLANGPYTHRSHSSTCNVLLYVQCSKYFRLQLVLSNVHRHVSCSVIEIAAAKKVQAKTTNGICSTCSNI